MSHFANAFAQIARNEMLQLIRTKRLLVMSIILLISMVFVTVVVPLVFFDEIFAEENEEIALENLAFLFFLNAPIIGGTFIIQILAILVTADAVCSEWQRRSVFLVLSKPVPRSAFVLGKYVGTTVPLVVAIFVLFLLDYLVLNMLLPGNPSAADWGRFLGATGLIILGVCALAGMGLFFSALTRSALPSMVLALVMAFLVFPIVATIGDFVQLADDLGAGFSGQDDDWKYDWSHYMTPVSALNAAPSFVSDELIPSLNFLFPQFPPARTWLATIASSTFAILFVTGAVATVQMRNFE